MDGRRNAIKSVNARGGPGPPRFGCGMRVRPGYEAAAAKARLSIAGRIGC